jgi:Secretion system C-terminal sorting domain
MKKILFLFSFCSSILCFGQQDIDAAGGNATGSGGTVSYSIGQVAFESATGSSGSINQGVQQPFEFYVNLANNQFNYSFSATLYPNPTHDSAILSLENQEPNESLNYNLTDVTGKLITKGNINSKETTIDVAALADACYFLNVFSKNKPVKTFKLLKHN